MPIFSRLVHLDPYPGFLLCLSRVLIFVVLAVGSVENVSLVVVSCRFLYPK